MEDRTEWDERRSSSGGAEQFILKTYTQVYHLTSSRGSECKREDIETNDLVPVSTVNLWARVLADTKHKIYNPSDERMDDGSEYRSIGNFLWALMMFICLDRSNRTYNNEHCVMLI